MLLNYKTLVTVSSTLGAYTPIMRWMKISKTLRRYWSASSSDKRRMDTIRPGPVSTIHAVRSIMPIRMWTNHSSVNRWAFTINTHILFHRRKNWKVLADKSQNKTDVPYDYIELEKPRTSKVYQTENIHMPTGKFAISGLRVFGFGSAPNRMVQNFIVLRTEKDKRKAPTSNGGPVDNAYNIYYGTSPDKLYSSILVHDLNNTG